MIDQELLKACVLNPCSVVPRMMLIDSMIETGWEEFKALEAFEPQTVSRHLPSIYGVGNGLGDGYGSGRGRGSGGRSSDIGIGRGYGRGGVGHGFGRGNGRGNGDGITNL